MFRVPAYHAMLSKDSLAGKSTLQVTSGSIARCQGKAQAHEQALKGMGPLPGLTLDVLQIILPCTIDLKGGECSEHLRLSLIDICLEVIPAALHRNLITGA